MMVFLGFDSIFILIIVDQADQEVAAAHLRHNYKELSKLWSCNIPLVSIGIIPVKGAPEGNVQETHYGEECFTT